MPRPHPFPIAVAFSLAALTTLACSEDPLPPSEHAAYVAPQQTPLACIPNLDGKIDASELLVGIGVTETYYVNPAGQDRTIDGAIAGPVPQTGAAWDWAQDIASDRTATVAAQKIDGKWYAASFPNAQWVVPYDLADTLENVYSRDDSAVYLLGFASAAMSPAEGQTLLVYDSPITVTQFPIQPGPTFTSSSTVSNGTLRGLPYAGKDTYEITVDATGELDLPDITFSQVQRVASRVTVEPAAGEPVIRRQVQFFFECFGEVARASAPDNVDQAGFTDAAEVRRLGIP